MREPSAEEADAIARKRAARHAKQEAARNAAPSRAQPDFASCITARAWSPVRGAADGRNGLASTRAGCAAPGETSRTRIRIVSWNMLAQSLVRESLFPGSDCLKMRQRVDGIAAELLTYNWDIGCFQEVDMVDLHARALTPAGYQFVYERGYDTKKHGLMIAWRAETASERPAFGAPVARHVCLLDESCPAAVLGGAHASWARTTGLSRVTRNVALFVALPHAGRDGGVVVATTHLFWHPRYAYERARQAAALVCELEKFRARDTAWASWPVVLAGDFNDQPHSSAYSLLRGQGTPYADAIEQEVAASRVIHASVDEARALRTVHAARTVCEEGDEARVLGRYRAADENELFDTDMLVRMAAVGGSRGFVSTYDEAHHRLVTDESGNFFCDRREDRERSDEDPLPPPNDPRQLSSHEPRWTNYSPLFHLTLDYIFLGAQADGYPRITALLRVHPKDVLAPGFPRRGVCASDHVMIGAEVEV
ncbi:hypothetical protein MSPP1_000807 [Malassezia sp. CBS 17886]|nr:hypothetical protein MSPP1_000807 [Malassezia sp. CBS 17886]